MKKLIPILLTIGILLGSAFAQINTGGGGSGSSAFGSLTSGTNNSAAMVTGSGSTLVPGGTGQLASSQDWYQNGPGVTSPVTPTLAFSITGGTLASVTSVFVRITFVGPAIIEPSGEVKIALSGCTGGNQCSVTVTLPASCTSPSAPVTGCTVWDSLSTGTEKQQAASAACVNITTSTCVIGTLAAGSSLVIPSTTGLTPTGAQTNTCPDGIIPTNWYQAGDGNYYPLAGIDTSALNGKTSPPGTFTFCNSLFVNDTSGPPVISNTLVSIHHQAGNTTTNGSNLDDRALGIEMIDSGTVSPAFEQSLTQYNERIVSNNAFTCSPAAGGVPYGETCAAGGRFIAQDIRTGSAGGTFYVGVAGNSSSGTTPVQGTGFANGTYIGGSFGANQQLVNNPVGGGAIYVGMEAGANGISGNTASTGYAAILVPPAVRFATQNIELWMQSCGVCTTSDLALRGDSVQKYKMQGPLYLGNTTSLATNAGTMSFLGSINLTGSLATVQLATPAFGNGNVAVIGSAGATTDSYKLVAIDANGNPSAVSAIGTTTTANATLTGGNLNRITGAFCGSGAVFGYTRIDVYRTAAGGTPSTTGKIGSLTPVTDMISSNINALTSCNSTLDDNGLAGDGTTPPTVNATGGLSLAGPLVDQSLSAPVLTGTGACATITTQKGGSLAGQFTCTGTTGASTVTITQQATAPNGWVCNASDITAGVAIPQKTPASTTVCTLNAATIIQNDVVTFMAVAY